LYYLAISGIGSTPLNDTNDPIFDFQTTGETSGPDGLPAGSRCLAAWSSSSITGKYQIALQGAAFVGNTCLGDCDRDGDVDFDDLACIQFNYGPVTPAIVPSDCDVSGTIDFNDLVSALFEFGLCESE